ncbi:MAG TPA: FAD-binding protein [Clostridiales bacterium]|nr:FAD-binding protein [Clostridiales bacterium]
MNKVYKALIIGSGAAAYSVADWLFKEGIKDIAIITENRLSGTSRNTGSDKQTYYKLSMDGYTPDSPYKMALDMFSGGSCDGEKMYIEAVNSQKCFLRLCDYGVNFPTDSFGGFPGYKTDHDDTLRATSVGPLTSKVMTEKLENIVLEHNKTPLLDNRLVIEILKNENRAVGVKVLNLISNQIETIFAENIISATGAPACIYEDSVYPVSQHGMTGVLIDAGVRMCNFTQWQYGMASVDFRWNVSGSFMQVIPRFVSIDEKGEEREFLSDYFTDIHEAYSFVFLKGYQWPFSFERASLSSQIDLAVHAEMQKNRKVFLDYRKNPKDFNFEKLCDEAKKYIIDTDCLVDTPIKRLEKLNSKAIDVYMRQNINLYKDMLKIAVCAQHNNGGVYTDCNFETDIEGLYVIGEAAGSFGLSRPGGSALNDTQVGGLVVSKHIKNKATTFTDIAKDIADYSLNFITDETVDYSHFKKKMSEVASFKRDYEACISLLDEVNAVLEKYPKRHKSLREYYSDKDMLISMKALLEAIIAENPDTGSRGGAIFIKNGKIVEENTHYRDFLSVTGNGKIEYIKVSPVPFGQKPFEYYLNKTDESKF